MSTLEITLLDSTRCLAMHAESGTKLITDVTPHYGGGGSSFSSTDLVGVALATCIGSSVAPVAEREGIALDRFRISVEKTLLTNPRKIGALRVEIRMPSGLTDAQIKKLTNAAKTCAVHRTLREAIDIEVKLETD